MPQSSGIVLLASLIGYPALLRLFSGSFPSPLRFSTAIKGVSTVHSTLVTISALYFLYHPRWRLSPPSREQLASLETKSPQTVGPDEMSNPTIQNRSDFANSITAIECGYLIQDTLVLVISANTCRNAGIRGTLDKTLLVHHVGIGLSLLFLQYYILRGKEKGVHIIVQFLLMNASTPVLNLRWYIRTFKPHWQRLRLIADGSFAIAFFAARVWLISKILSDYGAWHGWSAWEAYWRGLRAPCRLGTGALWVANLGWWSVLIWNVASRSTNLTLGGQ